MSKESSTSKRKADDEIPEGFRIVMDATVDKLRTFSRSRHWVFCWNGIKYQGYCTKSFDKGSGEHAIVKLYFKFNLKDCIFNIKLEITRYFVVDGINDFSCDFEKTLEHIDYEGDTFFQQIDNEVNNHLQVQFEHFNEYRYPREIQLTNGPLPNIKKSADIKDMVEAVKTYCATNALLLHFEYDPKTEFVKCHSIRHFSGLDSRVEEYRNVDIKLRFDLEKRCFVTSTSIIRRKESYANRRISYNFHIQDRELYNTDDIKQFFLVYLVKYIHLNIPEIEYGPMPPAHSPPQRGSGGLNSMTHIDYGTIATLLEDMHHRISLLEVSI